VARTLKFFFRILLCLVGQDETTKKKSSETINNRPARGSSEGSTRLPTQISSGGTACHRLRAAPAPTRVPWAPAPASRHRTAPGAPRVPVALGQRKNVGPSSSETELWMIFLAPTARHRAASRAPCVPAAPGRMKNVEPMQKT
jgi:hypothetical protein